MPTQQYGTVITSYGAARIAAAISSGTQYQIISAAVGDGNGAYYYPSAEQTALKREVWRGQLAAVGTDPDNANMINAKFIIPPTEGGFTVREAGLFDAEGGLLALCNLPDTQKSIYTSGITGKLTIIIHIVVSDTGVLEFEIHPELDAITQEQLNAAVAEHAVDTSAHSDIRASIPQEALNAVSELLGGVSLDVYLSSMAIDGGDWDALDTPLSMHNFDEMAHVSAPFDGGIIGAPDANGHSEDLAMHEVDENAHPNIILDAGSIETEGEI